MNAGQVETSCWLNQLYAEQVELMMAVVKARASAHPTILGRERKVRVPSRAPAARPRPRGPIAMVVEDLGKVFFVVYRVSLPVCAHSGSRRQ